MTFYPPNHWRWKSGYHRASLDSSFYHRHNSSSGPVSTGLTLRDQEELLQDLKKENFDLKLRLYMEEMNNASTSSRASEYESGLGDLLEKLENALSENERLNSEVRESRMRERALITKQKRLELKCAEQSEEIHKLYASVQNLSVAHSTPIRSSQSEYNIRPVSQVESDGGDEFDERKPLSPIDGPDGPPFDRFTRSQSDTDGYMKTQSLPGKNSYSTTHVSNFYSYDIREGGVPRSEDNVVIVPPNNARIQSDMVPIEEPPTRRKKKKKGLRKLFGLCAGRSAES